MADTDDALLVEIRDRFDRAVDGWKEIQDQAKIDMRYVAGDPWDPKDRKARENANRPCLALDELGQYFNQVVNDVRANPRAVKFSPVGNGANDATAEFYGDKTREIEYRSKAQMAYTTAFQNAVERSYGWVRLTTKFLPKSFDQDLWIEPVYNPDNVLPDPDAQKPESSDMQYLFFFETWPTKEFQRAFPDADVTSFNDYMGQPGIARWLTNDRVTVAEYWRIVKQKKKLLLFRAAEGQLVTAYEDEPIPPGVVILQSRDEEVPSVEQYLTNGVEILKGPTRWAGKYIPFASCFGKILYVDEGSGAKRKLMSMTRLARDPSMLYCFYRTAEAEQVGMSTKFPYFWYEGQLGADAQDDLQRSLHEPVAGIKVKPTVDGTGPGVVLPHPQRNPFEPAIQALEIGAEGARRAIQAAMAANFLPTQAQRTNEKSGVALRQIEQSAQKGTYHFVDHYDDMIAHVGVMLEDLIPKILDTPREVGVRKANDEPGLIRINDPSAQGPQDLPSIAGDHLVTISTGPAYESQRQQASEFADQLVTIGDPEILRLIAPLVVKLKNLGPIGDEIVQLLELVQPPMARQLNQGDTPDPMQLAQQLQQAMQMLEAARQQVTEQGQIIATDQVKADNQMRLEAMKQQSEMLKIKADLLKVQAQSEGKQADTALQGQIDAELAQLQGQIDLMLQRDAHRQQISTQARQQAHDATMASRQSSQER